jgi:hypothetical protein
VHKGAYHLQPFFRSSCKRISDWTPVSCNLPGLKPHNPRFADNKGVDRAPDEAFWYRPWLISSFQKE